jgi:glucose-6-phosphate isomerase
MPRLDAESFGQLFYFFSYGVSLSGRLLEVDPYDQPGVEAYKSLMFEALGRPF